MEHTNIIDNIWMERAIFLAKKGRYTTSPNPAVGAVIVNNQKLVGEGWHRQAGEDHAEIIALNKAGTKAVGSTCYITLEPCNHTGRTGPCTKALVESGVKEVVIGIIDPNPMVNMRGIKYLKDMGVEVRTGVLSDQIKELNKYFLKRISTGRPYVTLKQGITLDGKIADLHGSSKWITTEDSLFDVQKLRATHDAILTSYQTYKIDQARLTVRIKPKDLEKEVEPSFKQPTRILLDSKLEIKPSAPIFQSPGKTIIYTVEKVSSHMKDKYPKNVEIVLAQTNEKGRICLDFILEDLGTKKINSLLVEAGGELSGSFIHGNYIDEMVTYISSSILGNDSKQMMTFSAPLNLDERITFDFRKLEQVGKDIKVVCRFNELKESCNAV